MMIEFMLDHWNDNFADSDSETYFVKEEDIDRCATERILRNQFRNPLWSSDSEDDHPPNKINWNEIFKNKQQQKFKYFVPCLRPVPPYPKVSELSPRQHNMILRIMCDECPNVLEDLFLGKPTRQDFKSFESTKETYLKEQKEYKEWAKTLWMTDHCIRALRPKPDVERVYEAEFKVKAQRMQALPKHYDVAAHITLENGSSNCYAVLKQELIRVTLAEMPQVQIPEKIEQQFSIIKPCTVPEPCQKHPYQIVLPNEDSLSMLPITEIHRELATFALNNETHYIASENALKCLTQRNRHWLLPLSVCETIGPDGSSANVLVLDSEFSVHKEAAPMRTYKAFRHLLEQAVIPSSERERIWGIRKSRAIKKEKFALAPPKLNVSAKPTVQDVDMSSDDEDNHLFIDTEVDGEMAEPEFAGFALPNEGFSSPKAGLRSPKTGLESPKAGLRSPNTGFESPKAGLRSLKAGFESPKAGFRSPKAGFVSPNAGLVSPQTRFSPNVFSFGSPQANQSVRGNTEGVFSFGSPQAKQSVREKTESVSSFGGSPQGKQSVREKTESNLRRSARLSGQESSGCLTRAASGKISEESLELPDIGLYSCTCQDTLYEKPPRRSFRKWQIKKEGAIEKFDIIIHSPHKARDKTGELLLEPLPEYQLDLGASEQSPDAVRSAALSLALRKNASLLNVRVDGPTGDIAAFEKLSSEAFCARHPHVTPQVLGTLHAALGQLRGLRAGRYLLQHEPSHGPNAMLMCPRSARERHVLQLNFDSGQLIEVDEAQLAKLPPTITTTLLPYHKHRRLLPCAFTPFENMVAKETKKPQPKKKAPPQAIKFPKRRGKKK